MGDMTSKERFDLTINHRQPGKLVIDFGATNVTGIHAKSVENLRNYYGLEYKPVRITDPYQMLGDVDAELAGILGIDVIAARGRKNIFGFNNREPYKEYLTPWGQTVLVSEEFRTTNDEKGDVLIYPQGDTTSSPSGRMPVKGFFFDAIIRQHPIDEEKLNPDDNLEEYGQGIRR